MPLPSRMGQLRQATRVVHDRLELALPLCDRNLTLPRYVRILEAFYTFYAPLEPHLAPALGLDSVALELSAREKAPLLAADLRVLGHAPAAVLALPRCPSLPTVALPSQAMGTLYVLEGATLGGQIIARHLRSTLDLDVSNGAAFFAGYGERTREMWTRFANSVEDAAQLDLAAAIRTAIETFETLEHWLITSLAAR
jgi:heme oxygenase